MPQTARHPLLTGLVIATVSFATSPRLDAQQARQPAVEQQSPGARRQPVPTETPFGTRAVFEDAAETRRQLEDLLRKYPVGRVLKVDPSLLQNESYLSSFPPLAEFLTQHPEIAHNPAFYFENVRLSDTYPQPSPSMRLLERTIEGLSALVIFGAVTAFLVWLIRTVLEQRRWNRLSRIQAEVHGKLMDRFSSNDELMAYVQTPSGQRFLESGPSPLQEEPRALAAPVARILWSLQAGVVLTMAGGGMLAVSRQIAPEPGEFFMAMGILAVALGLGFIISAGLAYLLSRKLGLFTKTAADHA